MINKLRNYWMQINDREQMMLLSAGIFFLFYSIYIFIYSPLTSAVNKYKLQLTENTSTLHWMNDVHQKYKKTSKLQSVSNSQFLTILDTQLHKASFNSYIYQLEQTSSGDIQLSFDAVQYNLFMIWLRKLSMQYAFLVKQLSVDTSNTPGVVKVVVILSI